MALSTPILNRVRWDFPTNTQPTVERLLEDCESYLLRSEVAEAISAEALQSMILEISGGNLESVQQHVATAQQSIHTLVEHYREQFRGPSEFDVLVRQAQQELEREADVERDLKNRRLGSSSTTF